MKKVLLILLVLGLFDSRAQDKGNKPTPLINGFGKIQLGMSLEDIPELVGAMVVPDENQFIEVTYTNDRPFAYELKADTTNTNPTIGSSDKRVRDFHLGEYRYSESIVFHKLFFRFFEGKLARIWVEGTEFSELLSAKYEAPYIKARNEPRFAPNGKRLKGYTRHATFMYATTAKDVRCYHVMQYPVGYHMLSDFLSFTIIELESVKKLIEKEQASVRLRIKQRAEQAKKKDIENF
jgi:hypothetical protein